MQFKFDGVSVIGTPDDGEEPNSVIAALQALPFPEAIQRYVLNGTGFAQPLEDYISEHAAPSGVDYELRKVVEGLRAAVENHGMTLGNLTKHVNEFRGDRRTLATDINKARASFHRLNGRTTMNTTTIKELQQRIEALEKQRMPRAPAYRGINSPEFKASKAGTNESHRKMIEWHRRVAEGQPQAMKLKVLLDLNGISIPMVSEENGALITGTDYNRIINGRTRCIATLEELYNELPEPDFLKLLRVLGAMSNVSLRKMVIEAVKWCLFDARPPMSEEEIFVPATELLSGNWKEIISKVNEHSLNNRYSRALSLGMALRGDFQL